MKKIWLVIFCLQYILTPKCKITYFLWVLWASYSKIPPPQKKREKTTNRFATSTLKKYRKKYSVKKIVIYLINL